VYLPAVSAVSQLLSLPEEHNRLSLYDLKTGQRRGGFSFSAAVAYSHFSADGKRLLVLTADQMVYVLDVASTGTQASRP